MTPNFRGPSIGRHPFFFGFLLVALFLAGVAGLTAPVRRAAAAAFAKPDISKANKSFPTANVPRVAVNPVLAWPETEVARKARVQESYGKLPLSFEANHGQIDRRVNFISRGSGYSLFLTPTEAVLRLRIADRGSRSKQNKKRVAPEAKSANRHSAFPYPQSVSPKSAVVRMKFVGANPAPRVVGLNELPGKSNYFRGKDPAKWHTNVPNYAKVKYESVYPGVDLVYYGNQQHLEYDFIVTPGTDPSVIQLALEGVRKMRLDPRGDLVLRTGGAEVRWQKPIIYQEIDGIRREVSGSYMVKGPRQIGFRVGAYDSTRPLIIDPILVYSTYLGGNGDDFAYGIAVDGAGSAYVTGRTYSTDFPTTVGAFQSTNAGNSIVFVTKLNATGSAKLYSTYLGGSNFDFGQAIAVDGAGCAYITGYTSSADFPTTVGAFQTTLVGAGSDVFVTKLNSTGSTLIYSTYLGGINGEEGYGITVDGAGSAYVAGRTGSPDFPTTLGAFQTNLVGNQDAFVTKLDATGSSLVYSTFLGGGEIDRAAAIAVDAVGCAYVTGSSSKFGSSATSFPTTPGAFQTTNAGQGFDAFVAKLNANGSALLYSTYLGGRGGSPETGLAIDVDGAGDAYVTGQTGSTNFPTTPGAFQTTSPGSATAFVTKLNATGSGLVYSTYLTGSAGGAGQGIAVDAAGDAYIAGYTQSLDFPTTPGAIQMAYAGGNADAFVTKLNASGSALVYSTYLGGSVGDDIGYGIALDGAGSAYVIGFTRSTDFPTTPGAVQTTYAGGNTDAFVAKIGEVADGDGDGSPDGSDNCPATPNPTQADWDNDGVGDACDPPDNKDQCKNGGWMNFIYPRTFKNQGDCIQFVNTGK